MKKIPKPKGGFLKKIAKILFLFGTLFIFFFYIPLDKIYLSLLALEINYFWGSLLIAFFSLYLGAVQLWFLARKQGLKFLAHQVFLISLIVKFYSFFSPISLLGSGLKWYKLSSTGKKIEALSAITFSRIWEIFITIFFGTIWLLLGSKSALISPLFLAIILLLFVMGWFTIMRFSPVLEKWAKEKEIESHQKILKKTLSLASEFFKIILVYRKFSIYELLFLFLLSFLKEIITLFGHFFLLRALHISIPYIDLGWMRAIFFLSALLPFTMIGGIGLREVSIVFIMSAFGIEPQLATAYSFLLYARSVLLSLSGGIMELLSLLFKKRQTQ